jgi:hypothetical protein
MWQGWVGGLHMNWNNTQDFLFFFQFGAFQNYENIHPGVMFPISI